MYSSLPESLVSLMIQTSSTTNGGLDIAWLYNSKALYTYCILLFKSDAHIIISSSGSLSTSSELKLNGNIS